jgi:hypothetical protein
MCEIVEVKKIFCSLLIPLFLLNGIVLAEKRFSDLPVDQQILLILTTLKYNKTFMNRLNDIDRIAIGYFHSKSSGSLAAKDQVLKVFEKNFKNKTFYSRGLIIDAISDISLIKAGKYNVLIVGPETETAIPDILAATRANKIVSATGITDYMKSGISLVVGLKDNRKFLGINLKNSRKENCRFSPTILQLAIILDKNE